MVPVFATHRPLPLFASGISRSEFVGSSADNTETSMAKGAKSRNVMEPSSFTTVKRSTAFCSFGG